eukprot:s324_g25.t1
MEVSLKRVDNAEYYNKFMALRDIIRDAVDVLSRALGSGCCTNINELKQFKSVQAALKTMAPVQLNAHFLRQNSDIFVCFFRDSTLRVRLRSSESDEDVDGTETAEQDDVDDATFLERGRHPQTGYAAREWRVTPQVAVLGAALAPRRVRGEEHLRAEGFLNTTEAEASGATNRPDHNELDYVEGLRLQAVPEQEVPGFLDGGWWVIPTHNKAVGATKRVWGKFEKDYPSLTKVVQSTPGGKVRNSFAQEEGGRRAAQGLDGPRAQAVPTTLPPPRRRGNTRSNKRVVLRGRVRELQGRGRQLAAKSKRAEDRTGVFSSQKQLSGCLRSRPSFSGPRAEEPESLRKPQKKGRVKETEKVVKKHGNSSARSWRTVKATGARQLPVALQAGRGVPGLTTGEAISRGLGPDAGRRRVSPRLAQRLASRRVMPLER